MFKKAVIYLYGESDDVAEIVQGVHLLAQRFDVRVEIDDTKPHVPVSGIIDAEKVQKEKIAASGDLEMETAVLLNNIARLREKIDEDIRAIIENYRKARGPGP
ncbi:MAG: hypothetical protein PHP63_08410 [Candidatus Marinimicrobia bacterium]|nr:hypothetical protein [Candidatus Neomarinimicrobiota bacterium]